MNNKYDDEFFDDLDKTTDLLKAFKSHIEIENDSKDDLDNLSNLYGSFNSEKKKVNIISQEKVEPTIYEKKITIYSSETEVPKPGFEVPKLENDKIDKKIEQTNTNELNKENKQEKTNINEIIDKINVTVEETKKKQKARKIKDKVEEKKQKEKTTFSPIELGFCAFSLLFILGCMAVYGSRFMKYYRVYNPKTENGQSLQLLTTAIGKNSSLVYEDDGLYMSNGEYVYKGSNVKNYIKFSNFTWRIIKANTDGSIDLVLDDYINTLKWADSNKQYLESDIHKYLNEYFINYLDKSYLAPTIICIDEVNDLKKFSCENKNTESYVRLLSVSDFLNSKTTTTYISDETSTLWLNTVSNDKIWEINGLNLSLADSNRLLGIKPVVKLKSGIALISGDGSKENPFIISEKEDRVMVGDYVKLKTDTYVVYDIQDDKLSLALDKVHPVKQRFDVDDANFNPSNNTSLAFWLNNGLYNSIAYKDLLIDKEWNVGEYKTSYEDVTSNKVVAKVGLYDARDLKFGTDIQDYFLINSFDSKTYLYGSETISVNPNLVQSVRPAICINNRIIISGAGTREDPYILEA